MPVFLLVLAFALVSGNAIASWQPEIKIFAKVDGAPKHYQNEKGEGAGYAVEIAQAVMKEAGFDASTVNLPWKRAQMEALAGQGVITAFSRTPAREELYLFSDPLYVDRVVLAFRRGSEFPFERFEDLSGKNIGIASGSNYGGDFALRRSLLQLEEDNGHAQRLMKLYHGRLDAAIFPGNIYLVRYHAEKQYVNPDEFVIAERPVEVDTNHIGIPLNLKGADPMLLLFLVNQAIAKLKEDGTIDRILANYGLTSSTRRVSQGR